MGNREGDIRALTERVLNSTSGRTPQSLRRAYSSLLEVIGQDQELRSLVSRNGDVLGAAYERIVPSSFRRSKGQFFTPSWAADLMGKWILRGEPTTVLDPGVGSGALLLRLAQHDRQRRVRLHGIDSDELATRIARANFELRGFRASLTKADFLTDDLQSRAPDGVICNPPYGRHQDMSSPRKESVLASLRRSTGVDFNGRTGPAAFFLARALHVSSPNARLAFITPSGWLDANYGVAIKSYLLDHAYVESIVLLADDHLFFDGVLTTSSVTLIRKGTAPPGHETTLIRLGRKLPPVGQVIAAVHGRGPLETVHLTVGRDWRMHSRDTSAPNAPLSDFASVRRGIATGNNAFFALTEEDRKAHGLRQASYLVPCITSPKLFPSDLITHWTLKKLPDNTKRWLLRCEDPRAESSDSPLGRYLRWGVREMEADNSYLARSRSLWYALDRRGPCPILFPCFQRGAPRFVRNRTSALPLNNWLIIEPRKGVNADLLYELLSSKDVTARLLQRRRVYGGGLWKLEPRELAALDLGEEAWRKLRLHPPSTRR